eukprot:164568_1
MAQQDATKNETKQKTTSTSKLKRTFSRIEEMEQKFQSLKHLYHHNLQSLADKIKVELENKNNTPNDTKQDENPISITRTEEQCEEFFDDEKTLKIKLKKLATLIKKSKHFVAFTGNGISKSAVSDSTSTVHTNIDINTIKTKPFRMKAMPTVSHMALVGLMQNTPQYLKYLISQNTDGLHRRSGIIIHKLSELHGNRTVEICTRCNKAYMRDYECRGSLRKPLTVHDHFTGRYCSISKCNGQLKDTIINFGESPHEIALELGFEHSQKADLFLCLGSSLTIKPACDIPETVGKKWNYEVNNEMNKEPEHDLVIVNIYKTDLDNLCSLRIFSNIDTVMVGLMKELEMDIPKWYLQRFVKIIVNDLENRGDLRKLSVYGVDIDGTNYSVFIDVKLSNNGKKMKQCNIERRMSVENLLALAKKNMNKKCKKDIFVFHIPTISIIDSEYHDHIFDENKNNNYNVNNVGLELELSFYGHYNEP